MQREMIPTEVLLVVLPFAAAFIMSMLFAPGVISTLRRRNVGQTISADGPGVASSQSGHADYGRAHYPCRGSLRERWSPR